MRCKFLKWVLSLLAVIISVSCCGQVKPDTGRINQMLAVMDSIYTRINMNYVEEVPLEKIMRKGIDGMFNSLDPYTRFMSQPEAAELHRNLSSKFGGTGMVLAPSRNEIIVTRVFEGFPANKAGIEPGDIIKEVDGMLVKGKSFDQVIQRLIGAPGKPVDLVISRYGTNNSSKITIVREEIKLKPVPYYGEVSPGIGYIQLTGETENCSEYVKQALLDLKKTGALKGLVLDLRNNEGGLFDEAIRIANFFLDKGNIIVRAKGRNEDSVSYATGEAIDKNMPIAILTNGSTKSAAEVLSGAIQDNDRGIIIGQKTFGKGLVGQIYKMGYGAEAVITVAFYYTPSGRCIQAKNYWASPGAGVEMKDSLRRVFKTKNGRLVKEAEGIDPDLYIPAKTGGSLAEYLNYNLAFFEYAIDYKKKHPSLSKAKDFHLTDMEYDSFVQDVRQVISGYTTQTDEMLKSLKNVAVQEGYFNALEPSLTKMENALTDEKMNSLINNKSLIKGLLEQEIVYLYYGEKGRKEAESKEDSELSKAIELLTNKELYNNMLKPH